MKEIIETENAPAAIGPYSQAVKVTGGEMLFCSGQIPINPETGNMDSSDVITQARQVMQNLIQVITAAGFNLKQVVKTTIYLTDLSSFAQINEVYASFFESDYPARSTVQVAALPKGAMVEIEAVAVR
ncbi:MAG TPA: RidA family protein [Syntrophorhabdaceae bacterium]|nr:RidA family protein [Syntrophorhabdaceae bacterium]